MFDFLKKLFGIEDSEIEAPVVEPTVKKKAPAKKAAKKVTKTDLNKMKKAELVTYAKKQGVAVDSKDTKKQIIEKLT